MHGKRKNWEKQGRKAKRERVNGGRVGERGKGTKKKKKKKKDGNKFNKEKNQLPACNVILELKLLLLLLLLLLHLEQFL